jgi:hypothetical protein
MEQMNCINRGIKKVETFEYCGIFAQGKNSETSREALLGNDSANTTVPRQQIRNTQQWNNWEAVFSTQSVL